MDQIGSKSIGLDREKSPSKKAAENYSYLLGGGFKYFLFSPLPGEINDPI